jgi:hypothetical protein
MIFTTTPIAATNMRTRISWKARFAAVLSSTDLDARDRNVIEDMQRGYERKGSGYMTRGRKRYFLGMEDRATRSGEAKAQRAATGGTDMSRRLTASDKWIADRSSWAAGFMESLISQEAQGRTLSGRQIEMLVKIESENTEEDFNNNSTWYEDFTKSPELQLNYHRAMVYYRSEGNYFRGQFQTWFKLGARPEGSMSPTIAPCQIPTRKEYKRIVENNKYFQKVLTGYTTAPKYAVGATVYAAAGAQLRGAQRAQMRRGALVIANDIAITSACKGNRRYRVLPVGAMAPIEIEERHMKSRK